jgi:CheY-like chemotaxis protein
VSEPAPRTRVLVVDDEAIVCRAMQRVLSAEHDVEVRTAARDALALIEAGARFDAILCDLMMPSLTGMELCARVRAIDPAQATRMLFVTGGTLTPRMDEFLAQPGVRVLFKPFVEGRLRQMVRKVIDEAAAVGRPVP